jgi:predicted nucleic acid-binding protein
MVRCLIGDDGQKIAELQETRKSQKILYTVEVIAEVVYVLTKVYGIPREMRGGH